MDQNQTRALWEKGQEAWNSWALEILQRKQVLEDSGHWSADWFGEGQNKETEIWLAEARADFANMEFASDADFDGFVFPGLTTFDNSHFLGKAGFAKANFAHVARFHGVRFDGDASFSQCSFYHLANFDDAAFSSVADFEKAEFNRESTGPLVPAARFQKTAFGGRTDFRGAKFVGNAEFIRTQFTGNARFDEAEFQAEASFENSVFEGTAGLVKTRFGGAAKFNNTQFANDARFGEAEFLSAASFEEAVFADKSSFRDAKFADAASFQNARFRQEARFPQASFADTAIFQSVRFAEGCDFRDANFAKPVDFQNASFKSDTHFERAAFAALAEFGYAEFKGNSFFAEARFNDKVSFLQAAFKSQVTFRRAHFAGEANFSAVEARSTFGLGGTYFAEVPNLQDASFQEPPRLDNMTIADPLRYFPQKHSEDSRDPRPYYLRTMKTCPDGDYSFRYRRLSQLASATHDYEREREFFAQELRCRRFWHDRPLGRGQIRFWLGWLYGGLSDFGRSLIRPIALWGLTVLVFALVYLGQRRADYFASAPAPVSDAAPLFPPFPANPEFMALLEWLWSVISWFILSIFNLFAGGGCIYGDGGATGEALYLSLKNAIFFLGWESEDASRRVYSCLYGFEAQPIPGGEPLLRVPLSVSTAAIIENMIGAALIVLLVMALRNVLRAR